ncbi:hypothetical protein ABMA28_006373 [Loxostege sticticalis]|uniref:Uncharacterized protein n=1 Tax=Loxostege sticticalis TaxID=481309 RepID=A0ABD0SKZ4_LOXSC
MHSTFFVVASLALWAVCACAPADSDVIQQIPAKPEQTPSVIGKDAAKSGAAEGDSGVTEAKPVERVRRSVGGQESDLLPSRGQVDVSPFGEVSQLEGRGRIRVLPAFLG